MTPRPTPGRAARLPELALAAATMVWGGTFLVAQLALREAGPFGLLAARFAVGTAALGVGFRARLPGLTTAEARAGAALGAVLFAVYALQTTGLPLLPSSRAGFLTALYVPAVPVLQWALLGTRPPGRAWAGVLVAFAGLAVLSAGDGGPAGRLGPGEWLTLGGAAAVAAHVVLVGKWAPAADPIRLAVVQLGVVAGLSAAAVPVAGEGLPPPTPGVVGAAAGLGLLGTAFALAVMTWAQKTVSPTRATVIYATEPVWAGLFGAAAGEPVTPATAAGAGLIVLGVVVSELRRRPG